MLGQSGKRVLVLEARELLGGAGATEGLFPGFHVSSGSPEAGLFRPEINQSLFLKRHGLEWIEPPAWSFVPGDSETSLTLWADSARAQSEIARFSAKDAERYPAFLEQMRKMASVLSAMAVLTPPQPGKDGQLSAFDLVPWGRVGLKVRGLGNREMMNFMRILPMPAAEYVSEWFESEPLRGILAARAVAGQMLAPMGAGTTLNLLYGWIGGVVPRYVRGGTGQLSQAIAQAAVAYRAQVRTASPVKRILSEGGTVRGVELETGDIIEAPVVVSAANPRATLFDLLGPEQLPLQTVRRVRNIRYRGSTAVLHLALTDMPKFLGADDNTERLSGQILINAGLKSIEAAYDDAKYGRISETPLLRAYLPTLLDPALAPDGRHLLSVQVQYAPYSLSEGTWKKSAGALTQAVLDILETAAPGLRDLVQKHHMISPADWEATYGLAEGQIHHGQHSLDQLMFMRPAPGLGRYRTPISGLYLCGSGSHPGGGMTGAPGYNAAREILKDV
jgi:phytoene dehydrogenase-like protein